MTPRFCLLAIRPLKDCDGYFRKNLQEDLLYPFYGGYRFLNGNNEVTDAGEEITSIKIDDNEITPKTLYYFNNEPFHFDLNISAIVGANGSGKSSLLELFYASCFYQETFKFLNDPYNDVPLRRQVGNTFKKLRVEIYFIEQGIFKKFVVKDGVCSIHKLEGGKWLDEPDQKLPFYSIAVNYSLYGLNSTLAEDKWLESLFHKNDGYKTPLVINPFREKGNINVNSEFHLAQGRLITNIGLSNLEKYRLNEGIYAFEVVFEVDPSRLYKIEDWALTKLITRFKEANGLDIWGYVNELMQALTGYSDDKILNFDFTQFLSDDIAFEEEREKLSEDLTRAGHKMDDDVFYFSIKYIIKKIYRICFNYWEEYGEEYLASTAEGEIPYIDAEKRADFFEALLKDNSHITLKLKQALYAVKNSFYNEGYWGTIPHAELEDEKIFRRNPITVKEFGEIIQGFKMKNPGVIEEQIVPAAFYTPHIQVGRKADATYDFKKMSSGEQQMVHSIQSIIYHILNINSVHKADINSERTKYHYVNIVLDEIELYYHPQYQKKFVHEFLSSLKAVFKKLEHIMGINILFSTHSPFILSDIPNWNVMKLEDGKPSMAAEPTFAANIHDLLANDFFLKNGYFGEWAKYKLENILDKDNKNNAPSDEDFTIANLVGEPMLRTSLLEFMLQDRSDGEIDTIIERLQKLKRR